MIWIIVGVIVIALFVLFARSTAREANRISIENDFRIQSLNENINSLGHLLRDDDRATERAERKAARYKARAEEVASRQSPLWRAHSKAVRRSNKA